MQNSIWKLTALAGVIGLGFLIVLQMQGEIEQNQQAAAPDTQFEESDDSAAGPLVVQNEPQKAEFWESQDEPELEFLQDEPTPVLDPQTDLASDPFDEPPAFLSEPPVQAAEPEPLQPESLPLLAGEPSFNAQPEPLPALETPPQFQLMSSEEESDPFATDEPLPATLPEFPSSEPLPSLGEALPSLDEPAALPETDAPIGLFASEPADPLPELPISEPEPLPSIELPESISEDTAPPTELFDSLPAADPMPELPVVADETYLVDPVPVEAPALADEAAVIEEPPLIDEPLPLEVELPAAADSLPEREPAVSISEPIESAPVAVEPQPVLTESTGEVVTELKGEADLPAELPPSAQQPTLTIEKIAPKEATLGKPMIYSIIVSNRGTTNAAQVIVEDRIPKGCRLVGTIPQAELIGTKLLWRFDRLPAGTKKKILVKVIPVEEGQVGSIATVNFVAEVATRTAIVPTESVESPEPLTEEPTADSSVALQPVPPAADPVIDESSATEPQIALNVTGPESAKVGDTVVLKFNISNNGSTPAKDVALQDIIPVGFEHPAGNDLTYEVGAIEPGKSIDVELELKAAKPGTHVNQAVITAAGNFRTESKKKVEVSDSLGLMLEVRELPSKPIGEPITLAFRVTNQSSLPVDDAVLTAALPAKSQFISATASGEFNRADRSVTWTLGSLKAEAVTTFEAQFVPLDFGVQPVSGTLTQAGREPQTAKTNIDALGVAALKISVDNAPPTTSVGEEFTIDVKVTNRGNGADRGIQLSLLLPTELEFVNARGPVKQQAAQTEGEAKRVPFTTIPEIGEKASVDFQITLRARTAGRLKLRAEVDSDQLTAPLASDAAIVALDIAS